MSSSIGPTASTPEQQGSGTTSTAADSFPTSPPTLALLSLGVQPRSMGPLSDSQLELQARVFRELLSDPRSAQELATWSALRDAAEAPYNPATDDSTLAQKGSPGEGLPHPGDPASPANADVSSLLMTTQLMSGATPDAQPAAAADPEPTFAELIERHVRRTLATQATGRGTSDEVRLELTDAVLPETQLSLKRSPSGWQLLAVTGHRDSLERLEEFAPALVKRFANASLGSLEVVTRLQHSGE